MLNQPILQTQRLTLRPFALADAPDIQRMVSDPAVSLTTLNIPYPYPADGAQKWLTNHALALGDSYTYAITLRNDGTLIGCIFLGINPRFAHAEMGYWIGKEYWQQGYCSEAAYELLRFGFQELHLHRIFATYVPHNPASGRVMQKIGMKYEGQLRQHIRREGAEFTDVVYYGILMSEFNQSIA